MRRHDTGWSLLEQAPHRMAGCDQPRRVLQVSEFICNCQALCNGRLNSIVLLIITEICQHIRCNS
jgi:hypothetical protein